MPKTLQSSVSGEPLRASLLAGLDEAELRPFLERAVPRQFADGQVIHQQGDAAGGCWIVESGRVKLGQFHASGRFIALTVLGKGASHGEVALLRHAPRIVDAMAEGPTRLLWIEATHFERVLARHPATMRRMLGLLGDQMHTTIERLFAARGQRTEQRLAGQLAAMCEGRALPVRITMTQQDLADLNGVTRVTIGTLLTRFARAGAVRQVYGGIEVDDPGLLARIARED